MEIIAGDDHVLLRETWPVLTDDKTEAYGRLIHRADLLDTITVQIPADQLHLNHRVTEVIDHGHYAEVKGFNLGFTMNTSNALFGSILAPVVIVALATNFDWHTAFYLTIIPGITLSLVILKTVKNPDSSKFHNMHLVKSTEKVKVKDVLKHRNIWLSIFVFSLGMTTLMAFQIFGPTYLVQAKGLSDTTMSFVMAAFGFGYAIFGFLIPTISERTGRKPASIVSALLLILIPLGIVLTDSVPLMMALLFLGSIGSGIIGMSMSVIPVESVPLQYSGLAIGLTIGIGELFGGFLNPMVNGALADIYGIQRPLFVAAGAGVLALLLTFFFKETAPSKVGAPQVQTTFEQDEKLEKEEVKSTVQV